MFSYNSNEKGNRMRIILKSIILVSMVVFVSGRLIAQEVTKQFSEDFITNEKIQELKKEFGNNKIIPIGYEAQILIALSFFPELKDVTIQFQIKKEDTPLSSRPTFFGLFQSAKSRNYIITISKQTNSRLEPILFKNLNFNAQIGVLGHELSHVSDYKTKGFGKMINVAIIELFSKTQVDNFERNTDMICINHGLGYQLLDWSKSVRQNLKMEYWRGADNVLCNSKKERYLNPDSIINVMNKLTLYK